MWRVRSSGGTADPVSKNCPFCPLRSAARRTGFHSSGATCHSSRRRGSRPLQHEPRDRFWPLREFWGRRRGSTSLAAARRAVAVFPHALGPSMSTTAALRSCSCQALRIHDAGPVRVRDAGRWKGGREVHGEAARSGSRYPRQHHSMFRNELIASFATTSCMFCNRIRAWFAGERHVVWKGTSRLHAQRWSAICLSLASGGRCRNSRAGDPLDFWRVEASQEDRLLRLRAEMSARPGLAPVRGGAGGGRQPDHPDGRV